MKNIRASPATAFCRPFFPLFPFTAAVLLSPYIHDIVTIKLHCTDRDLGGWQ